MRLVDESWVQKLYDNPPALESTKAVKRVIPLIEKLDREAHKQGQKGTCAPGILSALNSINLASRQDLQLVRDANQEFRTLLVKEKENRRRLKWFAENQQYRYVPLNSHIIPDCREAMRQLGEAIKATEEVKREISLSVKRTLGKRPQVMPYVVLRLLKIVQKHAGKSVYAAAPRVREMLIAYKDDKNHEWIPSVRRIRDIGYQERTRLA